MQSAGILHAVYRILLTTIVAAAAAPHYAHDARKLIDTLPNIWLAFLEHPSPGDRAFPDFQALPARGGPSPSLI